MYSRICDLPTEKRKHARAQTHAQTAAWRGTPTSVRKGDPWRPSEREPLGAGVWPRLESLQIIDLQGREAGICRDLRQYLPTPGPYSRGLEIRSESISGECEEGNFVSGLLGEGWDFTG